MPSAAIVISSSVNSVSVSSSLTTDIKEVGNRFFVLFLICTAMVVIGVILEEIKLFTRKPYVDAETGILIPGSSKSLAALGLWILVLGITGEGLFEMARVWIDRISEDFSNSLLLNAEALTGSAAKSARIAREEADAAKSASSKAQTRADDAEKRVSAVDNKAKKIGSDLVATGKQLNELDAKRNELERSLTPRPALATFAPGKPSIEPLKAFAGINVLLEYLPSEPPQDVGSLRGVLYAVHWNITGDEYNQNIFMPGVTIIRHLSRQYNSAEGQKDEQRSHDAATALCEFLAASGWDVMTAMGGRVGGPPANTIRVEVGRKPQPYFESVREKEKRREIDKVLDETKKVVEEVGIKDPHCI